MEFLWMVVILLSAVVCTHIVKETQRAELRFPLEVQDPEKMREQVEMLAGHCVAAAERCYMEGCIGLEQVKHVALIDLEEVLERLYAGEVMEREGLVALIDEIIEPGEHI